MKKNAKGLFDKGSNILIYKMGNNVKVEVILENEDIWLSQEQISKLYNKSKSTINEHIKNIYLENELLETSTKRNSEIPNFLLNRLITIILI